MWKCPKCSKTSTSHQVIMKHYYKEHHKSKAKAKSNKGKEKKVYTFKPMKTKR